MNNKKLYFKKWYCKKNFGINDVVECNEEICTITEKAVCFWLIREDVRKLWIPLSALFVYDGEKENEEDIENKNSKVTIDKTLEEVKLFLASIQKMTFQEALSECNFYKDCYC